MSFYDFILGFINDDTTLGHLAHYIFNDACFPKEEKNNNSIRTYVLLNYNDRQLIESTNRAISLYQLI